MTAAASLAHRFAHHPPSPEAIERHKAVRRAALDCASTLVAVAPQSRERELAIEALDQACMLANAAIARHG